MSIDENLHKIKQVIKSIFPECRIILFGSRSKSNFVGKSDYDILVIVKKKLDVNKKFQYGSIIRKSLAKLEIDIDIIVKSEHELKLSDDEMVMSYFRNYENTKIAHKIRKNENQQRYLEPLIKYIKVTYRRKK